METTSKEGLSWGVTDAVGSGIGERLALESPGRTHAISAATAKPTTSHFIDVILDNERSDKR